MPQLSNLVLTDRTTPTPVDHTFVPRDIQSGVATVVESSGVPVGENRVSLSLRKNTTNKRYRGRLVATFPVVATEVINGISTPKVVRTATVEVLTNFDSTSSEQERADAIGMVASALSASKTLVNDCLVKLQNVY